MECFDSITDSSLDSWCWPPQERDCQLSSHPDQLCISANRFKHCAHLRESRTIAADCCLSTNPALETVVQTELCERVYLCGTSSVTASTKARGGGGGDWPQ